MFEADDLSDRVAFINEGSVLAIDTPEELKLAHGQRSVKIRSRNEQGTSEVTVALDTPSTAEELRAAMDHGEILTIHHGRSHIGGHLCGVCWTRTRDMNTSAVAAIVAKDVRAFSRDRFYLFMTILGLLFYVGIFWFLPDTVDETIEMGVSYEGLDAAFQSLTDGEEGLALTNFESVESLEAAIRSGDGPAVGLAFPPNFATDVANGIETEVTLFVTSVVPPRYEEP